MKHVQIRSERSAFEEARALLPEALRARLPERCAEDAEEIRLRVGRPMSVIFRGTETGLAGDAVDAEILMQVLEKATGASLHSAAQSISRGYINYRGLRIGLCGEAAAGCGQTTGFRSYSSLAIRIPHMCRGVCDEAARQLFSDGPASVLIISPPGVGKTTALRELVRILGDRGCRAAVADERGELSASYNGQAAFDMGRCSDVLVNVPKAEGAMMLLRGMNPQLIAMDEITRSDDIKAIESICGCGVAVLASAHAKSLEDMLRRPLYRELMDLGVFDWLMSIGIRQGSRCYSVRRLSA